MSLLERVHYILKCDTCSRSFGYFEGVKYAPQDVLRLAEQQYGWYVDDELTLCVSCPHPGEELLDGEG